MLTGFKFIGEVIKKYEDEGHGTFLLGFEESYLTVGEFNGYEKNLHAKLVPMNAAINGFRSSLQAMKLMAKDKKKEVPPPVSFNDHI